MSASSIDLATVSLTYYTPSSIRVSGPHPLQTAGPATSSMNSNLPSMATAPSSIAPPSAAGGASNNPLSVTASYSPGVSVPYYTPSGGYTSVPSRSYESYAASGYGSPSMASSDMASTPLSVTSVVPGISTMTNSEVATADIPGPYSSSMMSMSMSMPMSMGSMSSMGSAQSMASTVATATTGEFVSFYSLSIVFPHFSRSLLLLMVWVSVSV